MPTILTMMRLRRDFTFDAAHSIREMGACERLHGHTYRLVVTLEGSPDENGIILDFRALNEIVTSHALSLLDHRYLNEVIDAREVPVALVVENPTAENVVRWIVEKLAPVLRGENYRLLEVELFESPVTSIAYRVHDEGSAEGI